MSSVGIKLRMSILKKNSLRAKKNRLVENRLRYCFMKKLCHYDVIMTSYWCVSYLNQLGINVLSNVLDTNFFKRKPNKQFKYKLREALLDVLHHHDDFVDISEIGKAIKKRSLGKKHRSPILFLLFVVVCVCLIVLVLVNRVTNY